jgi:hypothetical protein
LFSWRGALTSFGPQEENNKQRVAKSEKQQQQMIVPLRLEFVHFISVIFRQK